jgi:hypothetical protein
MGSVAHAYTDQSTPISDSDVERLQLLHRATLAGHSIGQIAQLPNERLGALVAADEMSALHYQGPPALGQ